MFVFYDTETTGTDTNFSQILQIGLLFTDDDLNVLSSLKSDCRPSPWVLPSPGAMLTTGFTPDDMKTRKTTNYEMMHDVNGWLHGQHWPVTFLGYNSVNYDEPVLAQNFYQNLLDPRLTTSGNGHNDQNNGRVDVMYLVEATALYMPGVLKLEEQNFYKMPSLTLKAVARQNGVPLSDADAHDALNDVKATVGVARVIKKAAPQVWDQMLELSTARGVDAFLDKNEIFTYANTDHYDQVAKKPTPMAASVMTALGDAGATGEALFDLRQDPAALLDASVDELKAMFLSHDRDKPLVLIEKDRQPVLMTMEMSDAVLTKDDDVDAYAKRAAALKGNKAFMDKVTKAAALAHAEMHKPADMRHSEMKIDTAIPAATKKKVEAWAAGFNAAPDWHTRAEMVRSFRDEFKAELEKDADLDRFVKMAGRLVYEHAPEELTADAQGAMKHFIAARLLNPDLNAPYMTIAKARKELSLIEWHRRENHDKWRDATDTQIRSLKLYYTALEKEYAPYSPYPAPANNNTPRNSSARNGFNTTPRRNTPKP